MTALAAANIAHTLAILNSLISATTNAEQYREIVAKAIAEGRDVSNEELALVSQQVSGDIQKAEEA